MRYKLLLIIIVAAFAALRVAFLFHSPFDISPDEAHYWEWSRRLDWSYYSKGPGVAWVIAAFTWVFGDTPFGIRIGAVVFSSLASVAIFFLGKNLFNCPRTGLYAAILANIIPIFSIGSILMTTDVLLMFFWAAGVLCVKKALDGNGRWWYAAGFFIGVGFLGKYTAVFLYPCVLLTVLLSKNDRKWLKRPEPYIGGLISLALASPVIYWNIIHGQVTIKHTMGQAHVESSSLSFKEPLEFLVSQFGLISPVIFLGILYGMGRSGWEGFRTRNSGYLLAFFTSAPIFLFFLFKALHGKVQGNWALASFVTALPASVWAFREFYKKSGGGKKSALKYIAGAGVAISIAISVLMYFPTTLEPLGFKRILAKAPYNRVAGWKEVGAKVSSVKEEMERGGRRTFIMSDTYQIASELALYTKGHPFTYNIDTGGRRMNQYDLWPGFEGLKGYDAIYVKGGDAEAEPEVWSSFDNCKKELHTVNKNGVELKKMTVFRCYNFKGMEKKALKKF